MKHDAAPSFSVIDALAGREILVTGFTGFLAKVLVAQILMGPAGHPPHPRAHPRQPHRRRLVALRAHRRAFTRDASAARALRR